VFPALIFTSPLPGAISPSDRLRFDLNAKSESCCGIGVGRAPFVADMGDAAGARKRVGVNRGGCTRKDRELRHVGFTAVLGPLHLQFCEGGNSRGQTPVHVTCMRGLIPRPGEQGASNITCN